MARTKRTARGSEASRAEAALVAVKARRAALAWEAAIRIMAAKPSDPDRLTKLPAELLDAIFADIYSPETRAKRLPEPLCKFLLPFQRRRYRSLTQRHPIGDQLDDEHLKELLSSAVSLERLHLHRLTNSDDQFPFLTLLTHPERFTELHVRYGYRYSEEIEDEDEDEDEVAAKEATDEEGEQERARVMSTLSSFLARCTSSSPWASKATGWK